MKTRLVYLKMEKKKKKKEKQQKNHKFLTLAKSRRRTLRGRCDFRTCNNPAGSEGDQGTEEEKLFLTNHPELKTSTKEEETQKPQ